MIQLTTVEWIAAVFGVLGTVLLARKGRRAGFGFVLYLVSNAAWISFAIATGDRAILAQNIAFLASSFLGIWTWLIEPRLRATDALLDWKRP
jgi:nicotinamide riboside transporter PnuC